MDLKEFDELLHDAEVRMKRLKALYEQWFQGIERSEPQVARKDLERLFVILNREKPRNTAARFRLQQLVARYSIYTTLWGRVARQIEEGTYDRDLRKVKRNQQADSRRNEPKAYEIDIEEAEVEDETSWEDDLASVLSTLDTKPAAEPAPKPVLSAFSPFAKKPAPSTTAPVGTPVATPAAPARPLAPAPAGALPPAGAPPASARPQPASPAPAKPGSPPAAPSAAKPPAPVPRPAPAATPSPPSPPAAAPSATASANAPAPFAAKPITATFGKPKPAPETSAVRPAPSPPAPPSAARPPAPPAPRPGPPAPPPPARSAATSSEDPGLARLYEKYVDARRRNNERVDNVAYDKLAASVREMKSKLREKHGDKPIDFEVVVQNGRVGIKPKIG
jgi:hypothetical protein